MDGLKKYWSELQPRERVILLWGSVVVFLILLFAMLFQPWHKALNHMETALPVMRENLVWMRQQAETLGSGRQQAQSSAFQGQNQSLLSIVEQTAKRAQVQQAIQQMTPAKNNTEVRVVLEDANFNQWLRWVDDLYKRYGVDVKQVSAERDDDRPNIAEIRVTFVRGG